MKSNTKTYNSNKDTLDILFEDFISDVLKQISALGSYQFFLIIVAIFYLLNKKEQSIILLLGFFIMNIIAIPIRLFLFKERPNPKPYRNIVEKVFASSNPSMHACRTTFITIFLITYFNNIQINIFLLFISFLIMYSRVYYKRHYLIDIVTGFTLGLITITLVEIIRVIIFF